MGHKVFLPGEWLRTHFASVRCVAGVLLEMIRKMLFASECFVAKFTFMWRLTSVYSNMIGQMFFP